MQVSDNLKAAAKLMIGTGVPAWFAGIALTENLATGFNPNAFNAAFATLLLFGGVTLIATGLTAVVVGAAIADVQTHKAARLDSGGRSIRHNVAAVTDVPSPVERFVAGPGGNAASGGAGPLIDSSGGSSESAVVIPDSSSVLARNALQRAVDAQPPTGSVVLDMRWVGTAEWGPSFVVSALDVVKAGQVRSLRLDRLGESLLGMVDTVAWEHGLAVERGDSSSVVITVPIVPTEVPEPESPIEQGPSTDGIAGQHGLAAARVGAGDLALTMPAPPQEDTEAVDLAGSKPVEADVGSSEPSSELPAEPVGPAESGACPRCGAESRQGDRFCQQCGNKLEDGF